MTSLRILTATEVDELIAPAPLRRGLEVAMERLSAGAVDVPPRIGARSSDGLLAAMPGHVPGVGLAAKLVSVFPANRGLPSHQGVIVLFDDETGTPLAIIDAESITGRRTAMTAAIAADILARSDASVLTVIGAGAQARTHLEAFAPLRPWSEIRVANRTPSRAQELVEQLAPVEGFEELRLVADLPTAITGADVVALCTHAEAAVIDPARVARGAHVSSVGSAAELPRALARADVVVVEWRDCVTVPPPAGAEELQGLDPKSVIELGDLIAGRASGRNSPDQVTVYKSTGHAVQDVAAARLVYDAAIERGIGLDVEL